MQPNISICTISSRLPSSSTDPSVLDPFGSEQPITPYTGSYRPGNGGFSRDGCYLVSNASNDSLLWIPPLPDDLPHIEGIGRSAVIMRYGGRGEGAYVLAELVTTQDRVLPDAEHYLWWSSSCTPDAGGQWIPKAVRLPLPPKLCGPTYFFNVDMWCSRLEDHSFAGLISLPAS
jgi:hypothetical protein